MKLESAPQVSLAHPFIEGIEASRRCTEMRQVYDFIGAKPPANQQISNAAIDQTFYTKTFYIGLYFRFGKKETNGCMNRVTNHSSFHFTIYYFVDLKRASTLNLSAPINGFKKQILQNDAFDNKHLQLHIRYLDRY
jgi:poly(A) polymerase Pap1